MWYNSIRYEFTRTIDLTYVRMAKKRPVMLHRALFGSIERFIGVIAGILGEHQFGLLLFVKLIPVSNEHH